MSAFYEMSEMTSPEFGDAARTIEIALVPVGATEQHGPTPCGLPRTSEHPAHRLRPRGTARTCSQRNCRSRSQLFRGC